MRALAAFAAYSSNLGKPRENFGSAYLILAYVPYRGVPLLFHWYILMPLGLEGTFLNKLEC